MPFVVVTSRAPEIKSIVEKILKENSIGIELGEFTQRLAREQKGLKDDFSASVVDLENNDPWLQNYRQNGFPTYPLRNGMIYER